MGRKTLGAGLVIVGAFAALAACSSGDGGSEQARIGTVRQLVVEAPVNGGVITLAGSGVRGGADNAVAANGTFNDPAGVAVAPNGTVYVADWGNNSVRRISPTGALSTFAPGNPNL